MRTLKLLAVAGLAVSTAACVETVDSNYGYGDGYYAPTQASYAPSSGYYAQPSYYAPTYYQPTQVVRETRYVPVPTPVAVPQRTLPQQASRSSDHHLDGNHSGAINGANNGAHHDRPQATNTPAPQQPAANNNQHRGNSNNRDRDGDGKPDRRS